jgi:hypothetical protein
MRLSASLAQVADFQKKLAAMEKFIHCGDSEVQLYWEHVSQLIREVRRPGNPGADPRSD